MQTGAALSRLNDFAIERNLAMVARDHIEELPPHPVDDKGAKDGRGQPLRKVLSSKQVEKRFKGRYAQVFQAWYRDNLPLHFTHYHAGLVTDGKLRPNIASNFRLLYCPLLPHHSQPHFDPTVSE